MMHCELQTNLQECDKEELISLIGALITATEDEAYAYDIQDEMAQRIGEVLDDHDIDYELVEEDI